MVQLIHTVMAVLHILTTHLGVVIMMMMILYLETCVVSAVVDQQVVLVMMVLAMMVLVVASGMQATMVLQIVMPHGLSLVSIVQH